MFVPVNINVQAGDEQTIYSRGIDVLGDRLMALELRARDMSEPFATIGGMLALRVKSQFSTQGAAGLGGAWQQLSEPYGSWKESKVPGLPILVGIHPTGGKGQRPQTYATSGAMRRSLLDPLATHVSPHRLLYTPDSPYAGYHQTGTSKMPARPPVALGPGALHMFDRVFVAWLDKIRKESGL